MLHASTKICPENAGLYSGSSKDSCNNNFREGFSNFLLDLANPPLQSFRSLSSGVDGFVIGAGYAGTVAEAWNATTEPSIGSVWRILHDGVS